MKEIKSSVYNHPKMVKMIAILNVLIQLITSVSLTFISYPASSSNFTKFIPEDKLNTNYKTSNYTLLKGESIRVILERYNIELSELERINQGRVFLNGIKNIKEGDEINVPVVSFAPIKWGEEETKEQGSGNLQQIASIATDVGNILSNDNISKNSALLNKITNKVNSHIQSWFENFGTAHIQLQVDKNFSLKNSQLELLFPVFEDDERLFFSQGGISYIDDKFISNIGIGYRAFYDNWML
ncbi:hypothetical protein BBK24_004698, partial [Escherichia coli]|nr:hypothetical protein [Escherichia coli]